MQTAYAAETAWTFGLIGDIPYNDKAVTNDLPNLLEDLNRAPLEFVIHDGDIKSGASPCTDAVFVDRREQFQTSQHPFFYVPGDNEWCDCDRPGEGSADPIERLAKLRSILCNTPSSLGLRTLPLIRQSNPPATPFSEFSENIRWRHRGVVFVGVNVPGSSNRYGKPDYDLRNRANLAWIRSAFREAAEQKALGVVLILQANPHFETPPKEPIRQGFNQLLETVALETLALGRPVVFVHGDSHSFRIDKPLIAASSGRRIENLTRVETFGNPDAHWVQVTVDPSATQVFRFDPRIVEKNRHPHQP